MSFVVIDIDGTIGGADDTQVLLRVCNEQLGLGFTPEQLQEMNYHEFLRHPKVEAYKGREGTKRFEWGLTWASLDPRCLVALPPLEGAVAGVATLSEWGHIAYYTARYSSYATEKNKPMADATMQWLKQRGFINPLNAVFCDGVRDKWLKIDHYLKDEPQETILIDDRYERLLEEFATLTPAIQGNLCQHLTLVAYGTDTVPEECYGLRVIPLSNWGHVDRLLSQLKEGRNHDYHVLEATRNTETSTTTRNTTPNAAT